MNSEQDLKEIRKNILIMVNKSGEGHIPSSFSVVEILYVLYKNLKKDDSFFLSKGHASAGLYAVLAHFKLIDKKALETFCEYNSKFGGHPHRNPPHIMNSSGSLGHGLPIACGYALGKKILKEPGKVFCLIGDGESNEGTIWETALYAKHLKLNNLICIVDNNNSQGRAVISDNLKGKFSSFGWEVCEIDGHNISEIEKTLFFNHSLKKPFCVIANTKKGKGIKIMEENYFTWHHKSPNDEELSLFLKELS